MNIYQKTEKKLIVVSGHQPAYLPWLGFFHKMMLSDVFIIMDDVQFIRRGFIHKNFVKGPNGKILLSVPLNIKNSPSGVIKDTLILNDQKEADKNWNLQHWKTIVSCYSNTPYFKEHKDFFEHVYMDKKWTHLSDLCNEILMYFVKNFSIKTDIKMGSSLGFKLKKSDLVLEHCLMFKATHCVTGMFGKDYIDIESFKKNNIKIYIQDYKHPEYKQRFGGFVPFMSAIDLLFNHGPESYDIIKKNNITKEEILTL